MSSVTGQVYENSDLFNDQYLKETLPDRPEWYCDEEAKRVLQELKQLYEQEYETVQNYENNEDDTIDDWIQPVLEALGYDHLGETGIPSQNGSVDMVLYDSPEARKSSVKPRANDDYEIVYQNGVSILEAKSWDTDFSKKFSEQRNYFDASQQVNFYLNHMPLSTIEWGILTDGRQWRIYGTYDHQSYVYYQINNLPEIIREGDLMDFKYFYVFFAPDAFRKEHDECFLDTIYTESEETAIDIGNDLQDNVFTALSILGEGFIQTNDLELNDNGVFDSGSLEMKIPEEEEFTLQNLREQSLIYLYRLMFLFYAESDDLLQPVSDQNIRTYNAELSLVNLRDEIVEYGDSPSDIAETYLTDIETQWEQLDTFFKYIDSGQESIEIQAYDGGLFDRSEYQFLNSHSVSNHHLAQVIYLISTTESDDGYDPVDYGELQIRHLGSIYEGLLQHQLQVAPEDMVAVREDDEEEWMLVSEYDQEDDDGTIVDRVNEDSLYLTTDDNKRKITGSFYTPKYIVDDIIEWTITPKIQEIKENLQQEGYSAGAEAYAREFRNRVLDLNILDPAMGSGHFLTRATSYLSGEVIREVREADKLAAIAIEEESESPSAFVDGGVVKNTPESAKTGDSEPVSNFKERQIRRDIAKECIFGVDRNPVAVELAKLSMWLETLAADQPLAFLDHHLKQGDSLLGSNIEQIDGIENAEPDDDQTTLPTTVPDRREDVIQALVSIFEDLINVPNETIEDARQMKRIYYDEIQQNTQYQRFKQLANVDIADDLGLDLNRSSAFDRSGIQSDAFHYMAHYLESDEHWYGEGIDEAGVVEKPWFQVAQEYSEELSFFHWKLEFPEVYYDTEAREREDAGFDAIIGNPPWLGTRTGSIDERASDYYDGEYDIKGQTDLAEVFIKRCVELGENAGSIGMVVPKRIATNEEFENLRQSIAIEETLNYAVDYGVAFEDVNNDAMVIVVNSDPESNHINVGERIGETEPTIRKLDTDLLDTMPFSIIPINSSNEEIKLAEAINMNSTWELDPYISIDRGAEVGMNHSSITENKTEDTHLFTKNTDVKRYVIDHSGKYIDTDEISSSDLKSLEIYNETPKILIRYISSNIIAAKDNKGYVSTNCIYHVQCAHHTDFFCGYLSSKLVSFWYRHKFQSTEIKFPKVQMSHINTLPVIFPHTKTQRQNVEEKLNTDMVPVDVLNEKAISIVNNSKKWDDIKQEISAQFRTLVEKKKNRNDINLDLTNYIGLSERDTQLNDIGVYISRANDDSLLRNTASEYREESLKLGNVSVETDGESVTVSTTVRYKPDDLEKHDLDDGYIESKVFDAFKIVDISPGHAEFIKEYVQCVVENHNDVNGFYLDATQTITPLERLRDYLEIPNYDEFADEWNRYKKAKQYAENLDEKINNITDTIDCLVYILFGLNEEHITAIEQDSDRRNRLS